MSLLTTLLTFVKKFYSEKECKKGKTGNKWIYLGSNYGSCYVL